MDYGIREHNLLTFITDVLAAAWCYRVDDDDSIWCVGEEGAHSLEELAELRPERLVLHLIAGTTLVHHLEFAPGFRAQRRRKF